MTARRIDLRVPVFGQREAECGNTSLKSVMWHLGRRVSARELARLADATEDGIEHANLIEAARRAGANVYARDRGSIADLRWFLAHGHPVLIGWWSMGEADVHFDPAWTVAQRREHDAGHFSVVSGIDDKRVLLMDPQWESRGNRTRVVGRRWMPIRELERVWYDTDTTAYKKVERWYMVAHRTDERFAARFGAGTDYAAKP